MMVWFVLLLGLAIIASIAVVLRVSAKTGRSYHAKIRKQRAGKDHFMKTSAQSPFNNGSEPLGGLKYFAVDTRYHVKAKLIGIHSGKSVVLQTSTGDEETFREYAHAEFEMDGKKNRLLIFEPEAAENSQLFLAFKDKTSAKETYGAGRYLDIKKQPSANFVELDFNLAYNLYCAYNDSYSCPCPPTENYLTIAIKAGEQSYH